MVEKSGLRKRAGTAELRRKEAARGGRPETKLQISSLRAKSAGVHRVLARSPFLAQTSHCFAQPHRERSDSFQALRRALR